MIKFWDDMKFWDSGEWQKAQEDLDDLDLAGIRYNPKRELIFNALDTTSFENTRVMFVGQDPYPDRKLATGLAFSIPKKEKTFPPTLRTLLSEYSSDLHYPLPTCGDLSPWADKGVLLWNCLPTCLTGHSLSHDWDAWHWLTAEIITSLREKGCVFVFFGGRARAYANLLHEYPKCIGIEVAHPSPRASLKAKHPLPGSRIFSRANEALSKLQLGSIDWRL